MASEDTEEYNAVHSYFIGPKGSNMPDFRANINTILDELLEARLNYCPEDKKFITTKVRRSKKFRDISDNLSNAVRKVAQLLGEHSVPFWSPRYEAHMCMDLTMPSLLGYFMTMLYNPNNVALEASPLTTLAELRTGEQLCNLFGYNHDPSKSPVGWGHITCDGTVANLESIWVARNLKFYPVALFRAMTEGKLKFVAKEFKVTPCAKGSEEKLFCHLEPWELLNLRPEAVLDLQDRLSKQFGISSEFLQDALEDYNIQTIGREPLEKALGIENPTKYFVAKTRHYSWPKGAAVAGIGSGNMVGIEVNHDAHLNISFLRAKLKECVDSKTAVYAVVAVIGSTEEGAVDRLTDIVALRKEFQDEYGLSFLIHADAAWGGYFATMLRRAEAGPAPIRDDPAFQGPLEKLVPALCLRTETENDLLALRQADSITVDPHKAGYIPYPAGSLVYRDGRMRHLVTWSGPYLSQGSAENIGIYGVEGSKPGASAMSTWFSNQTIGLDPDGYGLLLGEAAFTSGRLSAHYATIMNRDFIFVPFNKLASETDDPKSFLDSQEVEHEREWIRNNIIGKDNSQIIKSKDAMDKLRQLGSDLNINAFTLNWRDEQGNLNKDLEEANYLMKKVVNRLSITSANTDPTKIDMFLTSTRFEPEDYGDCALHFMERMGIDKCKQGLFVLRNVVMSPFPTEMNFIDGLMAGLQDVIREEVQICRERNRRGKRNVQFLVQGTPSEPTTDVFVVLQTSFHSATLRQQLIFSATLDEPQTAFYKSLFESSEESRIILESVEPLDIETVDDTIRETGPVSVQTKIYGQNNDLDSQTGTARLNSVVVSRPLNSANRDSEYPADFMPFYLYGTENEMHISHMLVRSPNIAIYASSIGFSPVLPESVSLASAELILALLEVPEASKQPFPIENNLLPDPFFFREGEDFKVSIWEDPNPAWSAGPGLLRGLGDPMYTGTMTLGKHVVIDAEGPNKDRLSPPRVDEDSWQKELDAIGDVLNGSYVETD